MAAPPTPDVLAPVPDEVPTPHHPYVPDEVRLPEFTWRAVLVGAVLGIIFGASSLYLVLKVGMTVSASIPVAVLSITLFRVLSRLPFIRRTTILENNIVQTTGSAGESIAFGVGVTMPALMLLGFEMDIGRVMVVSVLGGLLGILMMIPLRRAFIVKKHGVLRYPEGTACADVLVVGEQGGASAKTVFVGFGIAFLYQFARQGLKLWKDTVSYPLTWFKGATLALETDPTLLGVGYIIGTRIACVMVAGGVLASFVLIPAIRFFGDGLQKPLYPGEKPIAQMSEEAIGHDYVLYIGAGAVAAGGIISLFQALPLIVSSIGAAWKDISRTGGPSGDQRNGVPRTDRDLPLWVVGVGSVVLVLAIWATSPLHRVFPWVPQLHMNPLGAVLIVVFGFLFVTVSSRLTGEIGSSSNPISGMTVATLLLTCLIFLSLGWTRPEDTVTALSVAAVVCIAASNGGTTSQDLKTGFLVGATPKWQQLAIVVGSLSSALVIGYILILLNNSYTVYSRRDLPAPRRPIDLAQLTETAKAPGDATIYHVWRARAGNPQQVPPAEYLVNDQGEIVYLVDPGINGKLNRRDDGTEVTKFKAPKAVLMAFITGGILEQKLPWVLVLLGVSIAVVLELCSIPSLAFAVGVYLPLSTSTPIFAGGLVRYVADRWSSGGTGQPRSESESEMSPGVLLSTGYIAGGAIAGVVVAFLYFNDEIPKLLVRWQYRQHVVSDTEQGKTLKQVARDVACRELGLNADKVPKTQEGDVDQLADEIADLNEDLVPRYLRVPPGATLQLPGNRTYSAAGTTFLGDVAGQTLGSPEKAELLLDLNVGTLIVVPGETALRLPEEDSLRTNSPAFWLGSLGASGPLTLATYLNASPGAFEVKQASPLGQVAREALGKPEKAQRLYNLNKAALTPEVHLPAGAALKVPQRNFLGVATFLLLMAFLAAVGLGWLLRPPAQTT